MPTERGSYQVLTVAIFLFQACSSDRNAKSQESKTPIATAAPPTRDAESSPCAALAGSPLSGSGSTGGPDGSTSSYALRDAASVGPCGSGGQCVQGPYCTPGGCVGANDWSCVYSGNGTCRALAGRLICGDSLLDGGTGD
jgi:hypothetical protein